METSHLTRPFRPIELSAETLAFFELLDLARDLTGEDEYRRSGVSSVTLTRDGHVTAVLIALRKGSAMREHRAPSAAMVVMLSGSARFVAVNGDTTALRPGSLAAFSADVPHAIEASDDAAFLVIIGGRERRHNT
jgi:quercetin dioxygenase-like cupin family protein